MQDFDRLIARFRQFGGMRLVWQYAKMGVLWLGIKEIIRCILHGRSLKAVYPVVTKLVDQELVNQYDTRSEIATIREHGSLRYGASAYDNRLREAPEHRLERKNVNWNGKTTDGSDGHGYNKDNKDNKDNIELARSAFEPASVTSDLNSEASAEILNQRSALNSPSGAPIWFCWLQGMENAPELVKTCLRSLRENVDAEIMVLDESNYGEYVELPEYIVRKYRKGIIPPALFSDMLRLELLIRYGGTWIDSTVWASPEVGAKDSKCWQAWQKIQESELFIYRYFNRESRVEGMSNWFIHAEAGNALLEDVRDMLYAYWHDYNCTVEYYIFHLFFSHVAKRYPEMIRKMPKGNSYHALWLRDHVEREISKEDWQKLINNVPFHKLNWRKKVPKNLRGN